MQVGLTLDTPETVLDQSGFSLVQLCRTHWRRLRGQGFRYEPLSQSVLLEPDLTPEDCLAGQFVTDADGSYRDEPVGLLGGKRAVVQCLAAAGSGYWLQTHRRYGRNQGFVLWFHLYQPAPEFLGVQGLTVYFGGRYALRVTSDGAVLFRAEGRDWHDGTEPAEAPYAALTWREVARGPVFDDGSHLANAWHRLLILPLKHDRIVVKGGDETGFCYTEPDTLEACDADGSGPYAWSTFSAPVRIAAEGGAFLCSLGTPRYATSGSIESPLLPLTYTATQQPETELRWEPVPGASATLTLLAEPGGGSFAPPADHLAYRVSATGTAERPTVLYDVQVRFPPTSRAREGQALDASSCLLEARESVALHDESARLELLLDNTEGLLDPVLDRMNLRLALTVDGERRFTGLTGLSALEAGKAPRLALSAEDLTKRLRTTLLTDAAAYDGLPHTEVVAALLRLCGLGDDEMAIAEDDFVLPARVGDSLPLFQPRNGEPVSAFLAYIRESFSGWRAYFDREGVFHYEPPPEAGEPVAAFVTRTEAPGGALPVFDRVDALDEEGLANEVYVIGRTPTGEVLSACFVDYAGQNDPACDRYVGERRLMVWVDTALATQAAVNWVCRTLAEEAYRPRRRVAFRAPWRGRVFPGDTIALDGRRLTVLAMETRILPGQAQTHYRCEPVEEEGEEDDDGGDP